jgi:hypothetical protein
MSFPRASANSHRLRRQINVNMHVRKGAACAIIIKPIARRRLTRIRMTNALLDQQGPRNAFPRPGIAHCDHRDWSPQFMA